MEAVCELDEAVSRALVSLERRKLGAPAALYLLATGLGTLPSRLESAGRLPFSKVEGAPERWRDVVLHFGTLGGGAAWLVEHAPADAGSGEPGWHSAFPVWLAAAAGASTLLHATAGAALDPAQFPAGTLALVRDHWNASGATPLLGLGRSRLGAQFPDQTRVHDPELRRAAAEIARKLGLAAREAVAACTLGPALETPAERAWLARGGAHVSAQSLADVLVAAAHAGLGGLTIVAVVEDGGELDLAKIAARSRALAPALDDLLVALAGEVERRARDRIEERT
jgi:purine nucleoside phosphorylase